MELASGGTLANKIDQVKELLACDTQCKQKWFRVEGKVAKVA